MSRRDTSQTAPEHFARERKPQRNRVCRFRRERAPTNKRIRLSHDRLIRNDKRTRASTVLPLSSSLPPFSPFRQERKAEFYLAREVIAFSLTTSSLSSLLACACHVYVSLSVCIKVPSLDYRERHRSHLRRFVSAGFCTRRAFRTADAVSVSLREYKSPWNSVTS